MKKNIIIASVSIFTGYLICYFTTVREKEIEGWASSQNGMLIPIFEFYRESATGREEEKMNETYHLAMTTLFAHKFSPGFDALDEVNTNILIEKILDSRTLKGLPLIEEKLLPAGVRERVLSNFHNYLEHIQYEIQPVDADNQITRPKNSKKQMDD